MFNRKFSRASNSPGDDSEKGFSRAHAEIVTPGAMAEGPPEDEQLHRGLKSRHITMIAIGGAIGTGLIIGT
jgi:amino acid transporter